MHSTFPSHPPPPALYRQLFGNTCNLQQKKTQLLDIPCSRGTLSGAPGLYILTWFILMRDIHVLVSSRPRAPNQDYKRTLGFLEA